MKLSFGPCTLDLDTDNSCANGKEIHLTPKAHCCWKLLISERPKVVPRRTCNSVSGPTPSSSRRTCRRWSRRSAPRFGDRARTPRLHPDRALDSATRFARDADDRVRQRGRLPHDRPSCWLEWGERRFPLALGEHVIGRDPDVDIRLDGSTVSRRHARLVVASGRRVRSRTSAARTARFTARRASHRPVRTRRRRRHPDRIGARDLPCARRLQLSTETQTRTRQ